MRSKMFEKKEDAEDDGTKVDDLEEENRIEEEVEEFADTVESELEM